MGPRHRMPVWEYKKLGGRECVCVCVKCFGGECSRVLGKLSHHLFIQSTEEGVSGERGAAFYNPPREYCRSRVVFLATSTILCLKK